MYTIKSTQYTSSATLSKINNMLRCKLLNKSVKQLSKCLSNPDERNCKSILTQIEMLSQPKFKKNIDNGYGER